MRSFTRFALLIACTFTHAVLADEFGLIKSSEKACAGLTLLSPIGSTDCVLINIDGKIVHRWKCGTRPGLAAYLLEDGSLLRCCKVAPNDRFPIGGGAGGRIQRFSWEGDLVWDFQYASPSHLQHHDIEPMPNGNVLLIPDYSPGTY